MKSIDGIPEIHSPAFSWSYEPHMDRYLIKRHGKKYQEIIPNRQNPAHTRAYVERSVRILNGEQ